MKSLHTSRIFSFFNNLLDFLFPKYCLGCRYPNTELCDSCLNKFPRVLESSKMGGMVIWPIFDYRNRCVKKAVWLLKYRGVRGIAIHFAKALYDQIAEDINDMGVFENFTKIVIVPIPLSQKRLRERGFNQSELIARELSLLDTTLAVKTDFLKKVKETQPQMTLRNKKERVKNVIDCFSVPKPHEVKNKNIILIDDVFTTGATLYEAQKVLKKAGARKIIAITVAH